MIDFDTLARFGQATRVRENATADTAEKHMTELSWLVEELQAEIDTFDASQHSLIHAHLISNLTLAIVKRTLLLRRVVRQVTGSHQGPHF
jgi:hypothetical protein